MGFPVGYAEVFFPNPFLHTLALLGLLRNLVFFLLHFLGLSDFLETEEALPDPASADPARPPSVSALLIRELLPVARFGDSEATVERGCACAVCLFEFSEEEEIRCMRNCKHIFHRGCVDRWIDHDQKTCPLCRTPFVPDDMLDDYNQRLWAASGVNEFYADYASIF
ncbi:E3 ubiquitin-protein ligase RHA1B [Spatholobus suberectus]|nr:E3 ubiquitin-protein ligase RHA1B [Spatholobus suberectus]